MNGRPSTISPASARSLYLEPHFDDDPLSVATGFVVMRGDRPYLITNRHNVTGRDESNQPISAFSRMPNCLIIHHNYVDYSPGGWIKHREPLYLSAGRPLWLEHPEFGRQVDVVALPLTQLADVKLMPWAQSAMQATEIAVGITSDLSIIGFPFGLRVNGPIGIWARGTVATEPALDVNDLPLMLIDSRTRKGQSGSPVVFYSDGRSVPIKSGGSATLDLPVSFLVGVYSGRINEDSDLGLVWKAHVIDEIIDGGVSPSGEDLIAT